MTPERLETIKATLARRQLDLTVVMENVRKPHNLAAVGRTLEAVGGLQIHAITQLTSLRLSQMAASGIRRWLKLVKHPTTEQGIQHLKQQGLQIVATSLCKTSKDFREADYTRPTAILVGEELEGISEQAIAMADEHVTIPMMGFVQSLNVSVASALVLYEAYRQRSVAGMYDERRLDDDIYQALLFEACHPKVAEYCRQKKLPYPVMDENGKIVEPIADSQTYTDDTFADWIKRNESVQS
ncbi:MAG: tRNA (guanosine(18)-2'-O)-methyltransferase TrmH [Gammaproteobacteria bacterium]|nr:tRNA (guanosine(18)-2'-O)-methyltransferase TrmH [Gammaproteobacteria bacterium]